METLESLSIESFSYSWLVNLKPSFESQRGSFRSSFDEFDDSSFIEMDPKLSPSKRFLGFHQDFDFDLPTLQPCVPADKLISNGFLVPIFLKPIENIGVYDSDSTANCIVTSSMCSTTLESPCSYRRRSGLISYRRCKRLPKRVIQKYLNVIRLIWVKIRRPRCDTKEVKIEPCDSDNWSRSRAYEGSNCALSPTRSEASMVDNSRRSCDSESSIYEAVLHCKKTIGCN